MVPASRRNSARAARRALLVVCLSSLTLVTGPPAAAQEGAASLTLVRQPLWHEPGDRLGIRLRVTNEVDRPLRDLSLIVTLHERIVSRSELHLSLDEDQPGPFGTTLTQEVAARLEPGESETVALNDPVIDLAPFAQATEGGVYPVQITLFGQSVEPLDRITIPVLFYPATPEVPLEVVPVLPLYAAPARNPAGDFPVAADGTSPLAGAVSGEGSLHAWLEALERHTAPPPPPERPSRDERDRNDRRPAPDPPPEPLRLALAPTPRTIEELADVADGYRAVSDDEITRVGASDPTAKSAAGWLTRLGEVLSEDGVQPVLSPYSFPDLPSLAEFLPDDIAAQLLEGEEVLRETAKVEELGREWLLLPGGRVDTETLDLLREAGAAERTFFAARSIEGANAENAGCPEKFASFTCPIGVETAGSPAEGFILDQTIQGRLLALAEAGDERMDMQRFFAEIAMIHAELPGSPERVISVLIPSSWTPSAEDADLLLGGLTRAPWLRTVTPEEGIEGRELVERKVVTEVEVDPEQPDFDYYDSIADASDRISSFKNLGPPQGLLDRLERNLLVSESRAWWDLALRAQGIAFATESLREADEEFSKISLGGAGEITLTSKRGSIEVIVFNDTGYPVTVDLALESPKLEFTPLDVEKVSPGTTPLRLEVAAQASGIFSAEAALVTSDGHTIATHEVRIRSTEFNEIALGITIGAFGFLVLWYVVKAVRRRVTRASGSAAA